MCKRFLKIILLLCSIKSIYSNEPNPCLGQESCGQCMQADPGCGWCEQLQFDGDRCDRLDRLTSRKCSPGKQVRHQSAWRLVQDRPLSELGVEKDAVQMRPQAVELDLRKRDRLQFELRFRQVIDYPVDLYYLMDLSNTMKDDKATLAALGDTLATKMTSITRNFRLGFGSFVDKTVMPYVRTTPEQLQEPCKGCAPPYSFRNHMPLDVNTELFAQQVKDAKISGNLDGPEGGLDAIMQAIVCTEQIGWRANARRLLVYTTDATFHYAGDGRLAGIYRPNDLRCHLDARGFYNESNRQDYPSISQIANVARREKVHIIFAVVSSRVWLYQQLSALVEGSSAATLNRDSSNVVDLIQEQYRRITSSLRLVDNATDQVRIRYHSACLSESGEWTETSSCEHLRVGSEVRFNVSIELLACPPAGRRLQTIRIAAAGLSDDLLVRLRMRCDCDCEDAAVGQPAAAAAASAADHCSRSGQVRCGLCDCAPGSYGRRCECKSQGSDESDSGATSERKDACLRTSNDTRVCSGNGRCTCNTCVCEPPFNGAHCECDPFSCERRGGLVCGGPQRGSCNCGRCECASGWSGSACDCRLAEDTCVYPFNGHVCNGHGQCRCGGCECDDQYSGRFCQNCATCQDQMCDTLLPEVVEQIRRRLDSLRTANVSSLLVDRLDGELHWPDQFGAAEPAASAVAGPAAALVEGGAGASTGESGTLDPAVRTHLCELSSSADGCVYTYRIRYGKADSVQVLALRTRKCPEPLSVKRALSQLSVGVLAVGLLTLLLWKLITHCLDKREFEQFQRQVKNVQWEEDQNPLYKPVTSNFNNPAYNTSAGTRVSRI